MAATLSGDGMLKILGKLGSLAVALLLTSQAQAQANATAEAQTAFQIGGAYTFSNPDYGHRYIQGLSLFGDYDIYRYHVGVEAEGHFLTLYNPENVTEKSYFVGPRAFLRYKKKVKFYGKAIIGIGDLSIDPKANGGRTGGTNLAYGAGGGIDYLFSHHLAIRVVDVEFQKWNYLTGLTPLTYSFGAAYRFR
jgi:hypothetical protein